MEAGSADFYGIRSMCTVSLSQKAWELLGLLENCNCEREVVCVVEGEDVQFFTTRGVLQVPRSLGGMIEKLERLV
jgi:hypothetical protein